jgi:hypothetical protein
MKLVYDFVSKKAILIVAVILSLFVLSLISVVLYRYDPARVSFYPGCAFRELTGLNCPGCGSMRAAHQLLHGHLKAALHLNPLMVLALPFIGAYFISAGAYHIMGKRMPRIFVSPMWGWVLLGVVIAYWILRNIPAYPFTLLSP